MLRSQDECTAAGQTRGLSRFAELSITVPSVATQPSAAKYPASHPRGKSVTHQSGRPLKNLGQVMNEQVVAARRGRTVREPLEHRRVLWRTDQRHGPRAVQGAVSEGEPCAIPNGDGRGPPDARARVDVRETRPGLKSVVTTSRRRLNVSARPDEPTMLVGCEDLLGLTISRQRDLVQPLHTVRPERGIDPVRVRTENLVDATGQSRIGRTPSQVMTSVSPARQWKKSWRG